MAFLKRNLQAIYPLLILILILVHGLYDHIFKIDSTTLVLIGMLLILPYLPQIRKIKVGDFEAEITPEEVKAIQENVSKLDETSEIAFYEDTQSELEELVEKDIPLGLSKIRIELERRINTIFDVYSANNQTETSDRASVKEKIQFLRDNKILKEEVSQPLTELINLTDRAIHGEEISLESSRILAESAARLFKRLELTFLEHTLSTVQKTAISHEETQYYLNGTYEVTTIMPDENQPEKRTYTVNQAELEAMFEASESMSEYIVNIEKKA